MHFPKFKIACEILDFLAHGVGNTIARRGMRG